MVFDEDKAKESMDEYAKDERLDLENNDAEYEPEEYPGTDYDEKEMDPDEDVEEVVHEENENAAAQEEEDIEDMVEEEEQEVVVHEEEEEEEEEYEQEELHIADAQHEDEGEDNTIANRGAKEDDDHHDAVQERRKRKEFEVFVGGLDKDVTEKDLEKVFSQVGVVTQVRLMMNPQTKKNKGFAFLRFETVEQAKRAVSELKNPVVKGKQCGVTPSQDSDTLFLGNISKTWTKEILSDKLRHFGIENVDDLTLVEDTNNEGMNRGFAFLEFSSRADAMDAFKRLQKRDVVLGVDRPAKVSFADSFIDPGDEIMAQVKTVFIDGLPASWNEDRVQELLGKYGKVDKVELARNMPSAKRKDFGFVTFDTHDAAVTCAKSINNEELGDGDSKAKVRARLSRPLQRGRGKHASRSDHRLGRAPPPRGVRSSWSRPAPPRSLSRRGGRGIGSHLPPPLVRRPAAGLRDRRPAMAIPSRARPVAPLSRVYDRRPPVSSHPKSSLKREFSRREELPPRNRAVADYGSRVAPERRQPYRDEYSPRMSGYPDIPRGPARASGRRAYVDDGYGQRFERQVPLYGDERGREYDSVLGSKRPYTAVDDVPSRYAEPSIRHSRARLDYELDASHYGDTYGDRLERTSVQYSGGRNSGAGQDSHGLYGSRRGMSYGGASYSSSDTGRMYSSSYGGEYMSRGNDVGSSSYSSLYSGRGMGGRNYMGSGGSGSYY